MDRAAARTSSVDRRRSLRRRVTSGFAVSVLAGLTSGCATFTDNQLAARVGDAELSYDELDELATALESAARAASGETTPVVGSASDGAIDGDVARLAVSNWVRLQLLRSTGFAERYETDPAQVGLACVALALTANQDEVDAFLGDLATGTPWSVAVAPIERAGGYNSRLPCRTPDEWLQLAGPEVSEQLMSLVPADPPTVIEVGTQPIVVRALAFDEIDSLSLLTALQTAEPQAILALLDASETADVYVDPRIGGYQAARFNVEPIG